MRIDFSKISSEQELCQTFNELTAEAALDAEEFAAFEKRRVELYQRSDEWLADLSDAKVEELLISQNKQAAEAWRQSPEGRYWSLAAKILGREPKGVPMPSTVTIDGKLDAVHAPEICSLLLDDDFELWRMVNALDPAITHSCWVTLGIVSRLFLMEKVVRTQDATRQAGGDSNIEPQSNDGETAQARGERKEAIKELVETALIGHPFLLARFRILAEANGSVTFLKIRAERHCWKTDSRDVGRGLKALRNELNLIDGSPTLVISEKNKTAVLNWPE